MSADPILVLQMRRMGDLILTFPLLLALQRRWPGHPLWVAGETRFYEPLMPLAPSVVFFSPGHCPALAHGQYKLAINLSGGYEAAVCLGKVRAETVLGPAQSVNGLRVHGYWQLYRTALTQNNHHNCFHWSDLFRMDSVPGQEWPHMGITRPRGMNGTRIGLVLGASEPGKHPDAQFWARLAQKLMAEGLVPIFLGGPSEKNLGQQVAALCQCPEANLCGRLSLDETAALMRGLALCITPDTGPMHLADWLGVPVLNLSMGPVEAWETGPVSPGQWVLRPQMSCSGCWQCLRGRPICRRLFTPAAVARTALTLLRDGPTAMEKCVRSLTGLALYRTGRDTLGLYCLENMDSQKGPSCRALLDQFWQACFLADFDPVHEGLAQGRAAALHSAFPRLSQHLQTALARLCAHCASGLRTQHELPKSFWRAQPPMLRLFAGYLQMSLQNEDFSSQSWQQAIGRIEAVSRLLCP
ncbi:MAG: glycosyltransferase family 9 protein [Desulfovibrio sp.]|nr:glycosyltransferase family 9 protein [Desulfovibrio sp.]